VLHVLLECLYSIDVYSEIRLANKFPLSSFIAALEKIKEEHSTAEAELCSTIQEFEEM